MAFVKEVENGRVILPRDPNRNNLEQNSYHTCTSQRRVSDSNSNAILQLNFHDATGSDINDLMINDNNSIITDDFGNLLEA